MSANPQAQIKAILAKNRRNLRNEAKRSVELWIYSFADMYMILCVFFIAIAAIYAAKSKKTIEEKKVVPTVATIASAGRGPAVAQTLISVEFGRGSSNLDEQAQQVLATLLPILKASRSAQIDVEGYADAVPLSAGHPSRSNLRLSNERAVAVAEWLLSNGIPADRVRTYSYGAGHRFASTDSSTRTDRRVVVKLFNRGVK